MEYDDDDEISRKPIASFFKLILQPRFDLLRLKIPTEFMATHGKDLSNVIIYLTTPPGKVWKFELTAEDGKTLLQKGWPEFVKFYSVSHGHLLVFKYQGKSRFDLVILDRSASEIEYPLDPQPCRESPSKKRKTTLITKSSTTSKKDDKLVIAHRGSSNLSHKEYERIRAYAWSRCKHPSFAAKMQPSFVNCYYMGVPKQFAKLHLENEPYSEYKYRFQTNDEDGKTWEVDVVDDSTHVRFRKGWKDFVLENKLKVDDICIFELISKQEIKVHVLATVANAQGNLAIK